jgi:hypothetical protein
VTGNYYADEPSISAPCIRLLYDSNSVETKLCRTSLVVDLNAGLVLRTGTYDSRRRSDIPRMRRSSDVHMQGRITSAQPQEIFWSPFGKRLKFRPPSAWRG